MMLYKPFVSFAIAFAATSSVAASVTPVPRANSCSSGSLQCCNTLTSSNTAIVAPLAVLVGLIVPVDSVVGLSCIPIVSGNTW